MCNNTKESNGLAGHWTCIKAHGPDEGCSFVFLREDVVTTRDRLVDIVRGFLMGGLFMLPVFVILYWTGNLPS